MDPNRIRAYLQAACAGLGFDIGEVWWTSNDSGCSTVAAIEEGGAFVNGHNGYSRNNGYSRTRRTLRFVQLYTSKSFESRRSELVNPPEDSNEDNSSTSMAPPQRSNETERTKHVLSPRLVDAIAQTAQVVWATTRKHEGLTGRSDIALHTAVGMPVAFDSKGNMCVVVMFSPQNIQSTDDALDFLQSISRIATSPIPCLLPAFDHKNTDLRHLSNTNLLQFDHGSFGEGVDARFVSIDERSGNLDTPENQGKHDLSEAPKDCFGIPMLPTFAELGRSCEDDGGAPTSDVFDEASYGVWTTVMTTQGMRESPAHSPTPDMDSPTALDYQAVVDPSDPESTIADIPLFNKPTMAPQRKERLEEFSCAFLGMSVFDMADVWIPAGADYPGSLCHVTTLRNTNSNEALNEFSRVSENTLIKYWSGAVGRAYSSGNPVWSANPDVFVDNCRAPVFYRAKIMTVLAIPVFSGKQSLPVCVLSCYSLVRSGSVPFVLRFVQQALRLLWAGLDKVEPHRSLGNEMWNNVAPADLGEMAADIEMQQHFMSKKRPYTSMMAGSVKNAEMAAENRARNPSGIAEHFRALRIPRSDSKGSREVPRVGSPVEGEVSGSALRPVHLKTYQTVQGHLQQTVRPVGDAISFSSTTNAYDYKATNVDGSKRAHVIPQQQQQQQQQQLPNFVHLNDRTMITPLAMPQPLPTSVVRVVQQAPRVSQLTQNLMGCDPASQPRMMPIPSQQNSSSVVYLSETSLFQNGIKSSAPPNISACPPYTSPAPLPQPPPQTVSKPTTIIVESSSQHPLSRQYCAPTSQDNMFSITPPNTKPCRIQGCNEPSVARRPYCVRHSGNRLCEHPSCTKCAQGSTRFCIAHGGGRRCTFPGCDKGARDKYFCAAHGGGKRCSFDGCKKSAVGGSNLCTAHGGGRRCAIDGCDKSAQSSTKFCVKHGGGKKCAHEGCEKVARGRTLYCAAHGGGVRCKLEGCNRVAIGKLQLCRAHGGGSRVRQRNSSPPVSTPSAQTSIPQTSVTPVHVAVPVQGLTTVGHLSSV